MIRRIEVRNFRSIRSLAMPLSQVTVVCGPNGSGKTNLYRAVELLQHGAAGTLGRSLASEGGMPSVLWAGARTDRKPVRMGLRAEFDDGGYDLDLGLPQAVGTRFIFDPEVKREELRLAAGRKSVTMLQRDRGTLTVRDREGNRAPWPGWLQLSESALSQLREPDRFPELMRIREHFLAWRFYHEFRADATSPARAPRVGTRTMALAPDGNDLAAALQTISENGDGTALSEAFAAAYRDSQLEIDINEGVFEATVRVAGLLRPLRARELSDGQLRYLCLIAALLSPDPPPLLAFNEPEASLHPALLDPLANLVKRAADRSQIWITTHSERFAELLATDSRTRVIHLEKTRGETRVAGQRLEDFLDEDEE